MSALIFQKLFLEYIIDFLYFPLWWYTKGIRHITTNLFSLFETGNILMSPGLWLKNIFVPMYGQYDWQGRLVSFFVRFGNVIARAFGLVFWVFILFVLLIAWIMLPPFCIYMFILSF
ncbi:MAG: hypothetical protein V1848_02835 [Candidatus Magasanikbacteria bacterium]